MSKNTITIIDEHGFDIEIDKTRVVKIDIEEDKQALHQDSLKKMSPKRVNYETKKKNSFNEEIDLHIENLVGETIGMSSGEKLELQLSKARQKIEEGIRRKVQKVILIHGRGKGVLRKELIYLCQKYPVAINSASHIKYGDGAMEIRILQNKTI